MRRSLCIFIIAAIISIGVVAAAPVLPGEFYGSVYLNGNPAPAGTVVIAKINGEQRGIFTTTNEGLYGGPDNFDPRLIVSSTEEEITAGNVTITFFVGGVQAFQTVPFKSGNSERLDLIANANAFITATTTATPTHLSSGGSSGSSSGGGYVSGGSVSSSSGIDTTSGNNVKITATTTIPTSESRSSIYTSIDAPQTTPVTTVLVTTSATPSPFVTTVPTTKKAGMGPLSIIFLVTSIIAVLGVLGRTRYFRKMK